MGLMVISKNRFNRLLTEAGDLCTQKEKLLDQLSKLRLDLKDLKLQKKIEIEDIQHMIRLKEERLDLAHEKKDLELQRKKDEEVFEIKNEYRDKVEKGLENSRVEMREMYTEVLARLPDVQVALKGKAI